MRIRTSCRPSAVRRWGAIVAALALGAGTALADFAVPPGAVYDDALATELAAWERTANAALRERAEALAAGGAADDKLAAFLLYPVESAAEAEAAGRPARLRPPNVQQWLLDAVGAPTDPSLPALWLAAGSCPIEPAGCDAEGALERLAQLDPGNGAVWLLKAQRADERGDLPDSRRWFARAADAQRIDFYDRDLGRLLLDAGAGVELPPMSAQAAGALHQLAGSDIPAAAAGWLDAALLGRWAAWAIPGVQWAISECRTVDAAVLEFGNLDWCRRLLARLADQATMAVIQLYALSKGIELQPELPLLREAYRQALWQHTQTGELLMPDGGPPPAGYAQRVLADGELAAWAALLEAAGIARVTPTGWLPDTPHQRELILTGTRSR